MRKKQQPILIEVNAKYINENTKVWCVHSGKSKKVLDKFIKDSVIALDIPGVQLNDLTLDDQDELSRNILMSEAIQKYYQEARKSPEKMPVVPVRDPAKYEIPTNRKDAFRLTYKRNAILSFHRDISKGDLIITPSRTSYEPFLFGVVKESPLKFMSYTFPHYLDAPVPAMPVEWIEHKVTKRDLPAQLSKLLERNVPITSINTKKFGPSLFTAVFGAYFDGVSFGVDFHCPGYRGSNPLETVPVQELIAVLTAIFNVVETEGFEGLGDKTFNVLKDQYYEEEYIFSLENEFHSPGYYRAISKIGVLGLMLLLAIPLSGSTKFDADNLDKVLLVNASKKQKQDFERLIKPMLKHMNPSTKKELNKKVKEAKESLKAKTVAKVN